MLYAHDLISMLLEAPLGRYHIVIPVYRGLWRLMTCRACYQNTVLLAYQVYSSFQCKLSNIEHKFKITEFYDVSFLQSGSGSMFVLLLCFVACAMLHMLFCSCPIFHDKNRKITPLGRCGDTFNNN